MSSNLFACHAPGIMRYVQKYYDGAGENPNILGVN